MFVNVLSVASVETGESSLAAKTIRSTQHKEDFHFSKTASEARTLLIVNLDYLGVLKNYQIFINDMIKNGKYHAEMKLHVW